MNLLFKTIAILSIAFLTGCTGANLFEKVGLTQPPLTNANVKRTNIHSQPINPLVASSDFEAVHDLKLGSELDSIIAESDVPVLLDFYADWCGPCKKQGRILHDMKIASNQARVVKINVDEHPQIARKYGAESIPMLVIMEEGQQTYKFAGIHDEAKLSELLQLR